MRWREKKIIKMEIDNLQKRLLTTAFKLQGTNIVYSFFEGKIFRNGKSIGRYKLVEKDEHSQLSIQSSINDNKELPLTIEQLRENPFEIGLSTNSTHAFMVLVAV